MSCVPFRNHDGKVRGFLCSFFEEGGRFLFWKWEMHKTLGVGWIYNYPAFDCEFFRRELSKAGFIKAILYFNWYWSIKEKDFMPGRFNPLWLWFKLQQKYKRRDG